MLYRVRVIPVARFYVSLSRALRGLGSSALVCRLERALQTATAKESVVEGVLLGVGAATLCFLLAYAIFVLIYCQVGFFTMGLG
ncbi:MAG: hypothetical protein ACE5JQ_03330 [Candidatus Methylomirabilales bacterium]